MGDELATKLAEMIANLSAYINEKALEIAEPRIEAAFTAARADIADVKREAAIEKQRHDDLRTELNRQLDYQVRRAERAEAKEGSQ